ncbi:MAG: rhodanese-like domain-containing protein [Rhodospirillaceae bacterium]|nr:rhodanese-like domain-containing protein [Rhodospirillaceae bacterium]
MAGIVGEVSPREAWAMLEKEPAARLIDVRSDAEWRYAGVPDLSALGKRAVLITLQQYPTGERNPRFADELKALGAAPSDPLLFICRSGQRSRAAAALAAELGFTRTYNVATGFEGPRDAEGHRATISGWKHDGLPWLQE